MKKNAYMLNIILAVVMGLDYLAAVLVRTFAPNFIIWQLNATNMVAYCLVALVLDHYLARGAKRCYIGIAILAALSFGLIPLAGGFVAAAEAVKLALLGAVTFTAATWVFDTMTERLSSGPAAKAAPLVSAFGLYLAAQCLMGMF